MLTKKTVPLMPDQRSGMRLEWRDVAPGNGPAINTSITERETAKLKELAGGKDVLEVGAAYGYSTVALALVGNSVVSVDPHLVHASQQILHANLGVYFVGEKVLVRVGFSQTVLPALHAEGRTFDLVFIDGDHTAPVVTHDVTWAIRLLRPGGVVACHDYDEATCPGVRAALDEMFGGPGELTDTLAVYTGLAE